MSKELAVYLNDIYVGDLKQEVSGSLAFAYDDGYLDSSNQAISLSLPKEEKAFKDHRVKSFFSSLLPDDLLREKLATYLGVSNRNPFALLREVGRECAGALSVYPKGEMPSEEGAAEEVLDATRLEEVILLLRKRPLLAGKDGLRLSLAGAQDKLAIGFREGRAIIKGKSPTTHILKPSIEGIEASVENELFCMRLAKAVGISVPNTYLIKEENSRGFIVERYDRCIHKDGSVERIHQEDFCQALGIPPEMKYEREGGPSIDSCYLLMDQNFSFPARDKLKFIDRVIFNYLIGNSDAHGKNFSVLYKDGRIELAPAYDLLSTDIYPGLSKKMAMKIGGQYVPEDVMLRHWFRLVPNQKASINLIKKKLGQLAAELPRKASTLKQELNHEGIHAEVMDEIIRVIKTRSSRVLKHLNE